MNIKRIMSVLYILITLGLVSCDDMFTQWIGTSGQNLGPVTWKRVDDFNGTLRTLNIDYMMGASSPRLAVYKETLYAAWVEGSKIYVKRYNGNDSKPIWTLVQTFTFGAAPTELILHPSPYGLLLMFYNNDDSNIYVWNALTTLSLGGILQYASAGTTYFNLVEFNGWFYAIWTESGFIRMKRYNPMIADWEGGTLVEGLSGFGINDSNLSTSLCRATVANDRLYVAFTEANPNDLIKVRFYDGVNWYTASNPSGIYLNYDTISGNVLFLDICTVDGKIYVIFSEYVGSSYLLRVRSIWGEWIDGGYTNYPGIRYNKINYIDAVELPDLVKVNGNLCAVWNEFVSGANTIRASIYSNDEMEWQFIDGNSQMGLNVGMITYAYGPRGATFKGKLYVIFVENDLGANNVHVKVGE